MRLLRAVVPGSYELALIGDTHEGSAGCAGNLVDETLDWVMSARNRFWCHMGDPIEAITIDDKRFVPTKKGPSLPLQEARAARKRYLPAAKRCLAFLSGNHDGMLAKFGALTEQTICGPGDGDDKPIMPFGGRICKLALCDKRGLQWKLFMWHPSRVSVTSTAKDYQQSIANKKARVKMLMERSASDCIVMAMGHIHQLIVVDPAPRLELSDDGEHIRQSYLSAGDGMATYIERDRRWYCATGSYLRSQMLGEDSYAEIAGYPPSELGHVRIRVEDRKVVSVESVVQ